jgi:hypothetical protein
MPSDYRQLDPERTKKMVDAEFLMQTPEEVFARRLFSVQALES